MGLLNEILTEKAREAEALAKAPALRPASWPVRDVAAALVRAPGQPLRIVAEVKFRSPSAGPLSRALDAPTRARAYESAGASMVSVLTDRRWFDGSFDDLAAARGATSVPLLCKDFVVSAAQVDRAWASGADAVLVIVRCVGPGALEAIVGAVRARGMEPFVEVTDEAELERALAAGARVVGVNARDLDTLRMDAGRAARVLAAIPAGVVAVHFSGVRGAEDAARIARSPADAALVGEALMRSEAPGPLLEAMVRAAGSRAR